jgi:hypothetical protein
MTASQGEGSLLGEEGARQTQEDKQMGEEVVLGTRSSEDGKNRSARGSSHIEPIISSVLNNRMSPTPTSDDRSPMAISDDS